MTCAIALTLLVEQWEWHQVWKNPASPVLKIDFGKTWPNLK